MSSTATSSFLSAVFSLCWVPSLRCLLPLFFLRCSSDALSHCNAGSAMCHYLYSHEAGATWWHLNAPPSCDVTVPCAGWWRQSLKVKLRVDLDMRLSPFPLKLNLRLDRASQATGRWRGINAMPSHHLFLPYFLKKNVGRQKRCNWMHCIRLWGICSASQFVWMCSVQRACCLLVTTCQVNVAAGVKWSVRCLWIK